MSRHRSEASRARTCCAIWLASAWLGVVYVPPRASAQTADPAALDQASRQFDRGVQLVQEGSYEPAVTAFERAYALSGSSDVLYNLGMAYVAVGRAVEAADGLARYLDGEGAALSQDERSRIAQELQRQRARISTLQLELLPTSARIRMDGRELAPELYGKPIRLAQGDHWVEASADGHETSRRVIRVGTAPQVHVIHLRTSGDAWRTSMGTTAQQRSADRAPPLPRSYRITGYTLGAMGVAAELAALTVYFVSHARHGDWTKEDARLRDLEQEAKADGSVDIDALNVRQAANDDLLLSVWSLDKATTGLAIAGAALAVLGGVMVWTSRPRAPSASAGDTKLVLRPTGFDVRQTF